MGMSLPHYSIRPLVFILSLFALGILVDFSLLPAYTQWALVLLILPTIFFLFRKHEHLDEKRLAVVIVLSILIGVLWDKVALHIDIWGFPDASVSFWLLGVPIEEYIFAIAMPTIILGIYTSLPHFRKNGTLNVLRFNEKILAVALFFVQMMVWAFLFFGDPVSYWKWLVFFAVTPSLFFLFRKGEKIDEVRLIVTLAVSLVIALTMDYFFIHSESWTYNEDALIGRLHVLPIDDILFTIFVSITIIGLYTALPRKHILTGRW
ncbi:MAG: lycopene cyclase domain-containing protein [Candidatus Spechtbacterales bacterium]